MTSANDVHDKQLADIKARHRDLHDQINNPDARIGHCVEVGNSAPMIQQIGLREVYADDLGRLWIARDQQRTWQMVVDPRSTDDTQAKHGFTAHE